MYFLHHIHNKQALMEIQTIYPDLNRILYVFSRKVYVFSWKEIYICDLDPET